MVFYRGETVYGLIRTFLFSLFVCGLFAEQGKADLVVGTNLFNLEWDRSADPGGSSSVVIPILWDGVGNDGSDNLITSFNFGFRIEGGTSGSLAIEPSSVAFPTVNPIFSSFATPTPVLSTPAPGVVGIAGENAVFANVSVPTSGKNAVVLNFGSTDAVGTFNIYADEIFSSYYRVGADDVAPFANEWVDQKVLIGTVTVTNTAVPEPGSWLIIGAALAAASMRRVGRRKS